MNDKEPNRVITIKLKLWMVLLVGGWILMLVGKTKPLDIAGFALSLAGLVVEFWGLD
jgi:hypothetical protein